MSYHVKARKAQKLKTKFIFVSGGVISSVGKGVTASAIALLLESRGYKVAPIKMDAYLNVDAGTIRPQEHGEVFVTKDGIETDQDVGNYERFMNTDLSSANYVTNGQIYRNLIRTEAKIPLHQTSFLARSRSVVGRVLCVHGWYQPIDYPEIH